MPTLPNGIEYQVCPWFGQGPGYTEVFVRDGSQISCVLACNWEDAGEFKAGVRGYSEAVESGGSLQLRRTLPLLCPYTTRKYAERLELVAYGNDRLNKTKLAQWTDTDPEAEMIYPGTDLDIESDDWFKAGICFYRVTFTKPPFLNVLSDDELGALGEENRYTRWLDTPRIRELKRPDYGFETDEASPVTVPIVGFSPQIEREIRCTWFQVPWGYVPHNAIRANALKVNSTEFYGHNPETLRLDAVSGIENPYEDADGGLYVDVEYIFKKLEVFDPDDPTGEFFSYGWNDFRTSQYDASANPLYKRLRQKGWTSGVKARPYQPVATFPDLFKLEDHTA